MRNRAAFFPSTSCCSFRYGFLGSGFTSLTPELIAPQPLTYLRAIVPPPHPTSSTTVVEISQKSSGGKLSFGLVTSLWFASSGMGAIIEGLNVAYDVKETRAWWRRTLLAILLTVALAVLIITALALMFYGNRIAEWISSRYGFGISFAAAWTILQWLFVLVFVFLAFVLIITLPHLHEQQLRWSDTRGTSASVWGCGLLLFGLYLNFTTPTVVGMAPWSSHYSDAVVLFDGVTILIVARSTPSSSKRQARRDPQAKAPGKRSQIKARAATGQDLVVQTYRLSRQGYPGSPSVSTVDLYTY